MPRKVEIASVALMLTASSILLVTTLPSPVRALTGGPDAYGYAFDDTAPYSWVAAAGVVVADMPTNCQNPTGSPDFVFGSFGFYGLTYTDVIICPNGFVKFTGAFNSGTNSNSILPDSAIPNADIIGLGTSSLDPTQLGSGKIYFDSQATQSIITWDNVNLSGGRQAQFQILLKDTGAIDIQYRGIPSVYVRSTSGIESSLGDMGLQYSGSSLFTTILNGTNVRYVPPSPPVSDTLTISGEDYAPATAMQTDTLLMARYIMSVSSGAVSVKQLRIMKLGMLADANLGVRIYNDTDNNAVLDIAIDRLVLSTTTPVGGLVTATFQRPYLVTPTSTQRWLIMVNCICASPPGDTFGLRISDSIPSVNVAGLDSVTYSPLSPIDSGITTIASFPVSTLTMSFADRAPATVTQGQPEVVMLEIIATVDVGQLRMTRLNLTLTGLPPRDIDVLRVLLAADDDKNGLFDSVIDRTLGTTAFTGVTASFFPWLTVDAGPANALRMMIIFDISRNAVTGNSLGVAITSNTEVMTDTCNGRISPVGFPGASSDAVVVPTTPNTVTITSWTDRAPGIIFQGEINVVMANLTISVDSGVARIGSNGWINLTLTGNPPNATDLGGGPMGQAILWEDMDGDGSRGLGEDQRVAGGWFAGGPPFDWIARLNFFGTALELRAGEPRHFIITMNVNTMADAGNSIGARIDNTSSIVFDTHTQLSPVNIPLQTTDSVIMANASDVITLSMVDLAPLTAAPFQQNVVLGSLLLSLPPGPGRNDVEVRGFNVILTGTAVDADVFAVGAYQDVDKNDLLNPSIDKFLGASRFFSGSAFLMFDSMFMWDGLLVIGGTSESILLVVDLAPTVTLLSTVGLEITNPTNVNIDMMTGDSVSPLNFPLRTGTLTIRGIPVIPSIVSPFTLVNPTSDGTFAAGEWDDAVKVNMMKVMGNRLPAMMHLKNDAANLYVAYDVFGDHSLSFTDFAGISFDTDNDLILTDGREDAFGSGSWNNLFQNHWVYNSSSAALWALEDAPFDSALPNHAALDLYRGFSQTASSPISHPVIEFRIPLALLGAIPGDILGFAAGTPIASSPAGLMDQGAFGQYHSSWPFSFGPMSGPAYLEAYGDLVLGMPVPVDVTVTGGDKAPALVMRGQPEIEMLALAMTSNTGMATLSSLNVTLTGSCSEADVSSVRLFDDVNDNEALDAGVDVQLGSTLTYAEGFVNFTGLSKDIAMGATERFLVVYDIAPAATQGVTVGAELPGPNAVTFAGGLEVSGIFPVLSTESLVNTVPVASGLAVDGNLALSPGIMHIVIPPGDPPLSWIYFDTDAHAQSEYEVEVWTGPSGTGVQMWDPPAGGGGSTSVPYGGLPLADGSSYYFRVRVQDGYEWSGWTEVDFRINTPPPVSGLPVRPPDGSLIPATSAQTVSWGVSADAEGDTVTYSWQVEENGTCTYLALMAWGTTFSNTSGVFTTNISSAYCWRVNADDGWESGGWSADWNFTTTSGVNNPPALNLPDVLPLIGSASTSFTYTVRYSDPDGNSPSFGSPQVWIEKSGIGITGSPFTMSPGGWIGAPGNYTAGRDYSYSTVLSSAGLDYSYYFTAADTWGASDATVETDAPDVINTAPALAWVGSGDYVTDGLHPETGTTQTPFTFRVVYSDLDNDPPTSIDVIIEKPAGTAWGASAMGLDSWIGAPDDYIAGAIFSATTTLSPSGLDYSHYFRASDGADMAIGAPNNPNDSPDVDDLPTAIADVWPGTNGFRTTVFIFDAANSTDDFGVTSWLWEFGDGTTSTSETQPYTYPVPGTYVVNLTVSDSAGQNDTTTLSVTVANAPPEAIAAVNPSTSGYVTTDFTFDGSASHDTDGAIVAFNWDFDDGSTATSAIASHAFAQKRAFTVRLTVTDDDGATNSTTLFIQVNNRPPIIVSSAPSTASITLEVGTKQTFSVVAEDPDADPLIFNWTVNGLVSGTGGPSHEFQSDQLGAYAVRVTASDGVESVSQTWTVEVVRTVDVPSDVFPWWLIALIAIMIAVSVILLLLLLKRRKSREGGEAQEQPPSPPPDAQPAQIDTRIPPPPPPQD